MNTTVVPASTIRSGDKILVNGRESRVTFVALKPATFEIEIKSHYTELAFRSAGEQKTTVRKTASITKIV